MCGHWQYVMDYHAVQDDELGGIAWTTCRGCNEIVRTVPLPPPPLYSGGVL